MRWIVVTETTGCTVKRTYEVESDSEPIDLSALDGAYVIDIECEDYDMEEIHSVEQG